MKEEIETMLKSGGLKLAAMQAKKAEDAARHEAMHKDITERALAGVLSLVPEELRDYASVDFSYKTIHVTLPGAAMASASIHINYEWKRGEGGEKLYQYAASMWLNKNTDETVWKLARYKAFEGEIDWVPNTLEMYEDLDVALARAVELGDGKAEAEAEAAKQRAEFAEWDAPDDSVDEHVEICPLMSKPCLGAGCKWFFPFELVDDGFCAVEALVIVMKKDVEQ